MASEKDFDNRVRRSDAIEKTLEFNNWVLGKLEEIEQNYKNIINRLNEVVYSADPERFSIFYVNDAVESMFGYNAEEWTEDRELWQKSIYPDDKQKCMNKLKEYKKRKKDCTIEYRIKNRKGEVRWVQNRIFWEKDREGRVRSITGIMYDVTEEKGK